MTEPQKTAKSTAPQTQYRSPVLDARTFTQSLPIDQQAKFKDALASGDPKKLQEVEDKLSPSQARFMEQFKQTDFSRLNNGLCNIALLTGAISLMPGNVMETLSGPANLAALANKVPEAVAGLRQEMGIKVQPPVMAPPTPAPPSGSPTG